VVKGSAWGHYVGKIGGNVKNGILNVNTVRSSTSPEYTFDEEGGRPLVIDYGSVGPPVPCRNEILLINNVDKSI